ncbi:MAG TPA: hypothetical protein VG944_24645 [Fimbriimonas sp.]|nr:hypothetical protein [Fimbriimonas sp.]
MIYRKLFPVAVVYVLSFLLGGCAHDDIPVSPNAATAAPARLPGEDPHAPPDRVLRRQGVGH